MRKTIALLIGAAAAALLLAACGAKRDQIQPIAANAQNLTMMLDWLPNADHVGIYEAIANGDLRDAGINLHVETPQRFTTLRQVFRYRPILEEFGAIVKDSA